MREFYRNFEIFLTNNHDVSVCHTGKLLLDLFQALLLFGNKINEHKLVKFYSTNAWILYTNVLNIYK